PLRWTDSVASRANRAAARSPSSPMSAHKIRSASVMRAQSRDVSRSQESRPFVQDQPYGDRGNELAITALVGEATHEASVAQLALNFRSDSAANVNTADRFGLEREVSGFGTVNRHKQVQRFATDLELAGQPRLRDHDPGVVARHSSP